jgi:tetratricopeptide (TPR) repeat protein
MAAQNYSLAIRQDPPTEYTHVTMGGSTLAVAMLSENPEEAEKFYAISIQHLNRAIDWKGTYLGWALHTRSDAYAWKEKMQGLGTPAAIETLDLLIADLEKLAELNPTNSELRWRIATTSERRAGYESDPESRRPLQREALEAYRKVLKTSYPPQHCYRAIGLLHRELGERDEAIQALREAIRLDRGYEEDLKPILRDLERHY